MIDVENKIFNDIATALRTQFDDISVYGNYIETPSSFPCVTLVEEDNYTYRKSQDLEKREHHANLVYTVNAYSNLANGKKGQAKQIIGLIDNMMQDMGFTRTMCNQIPNIDRTIYRILARYTAVVEQGKTDTSGDITHTIYRR